MTSVVAFAALWAVAAVTPGPNMLLITGTALDASRKIAAWAVAGVLVGTAIWGAAGYFGVGLLFSSAPWVYLGLKLMGGAYVVYLGVRLLLKTPSPLADPVIVGRRSGWRAFRRGLTTQLSNPKAGAFVATIFAATMPREAPLSAGLTAILTMVTISGLWYGALCWSFGLAAIRARYMRARRAIERAAGALFVAFGIGIATSR